MLISYFEKEHQQTMSWLEAPAVVSDSQTKWIGSARFSGGWYVILKVRYKVPTSQAISGSWNGVVSSSHPVWKPKVIDWSGNDKIRTLLSEYPAGKKITIYYNPDKPEDWVLHKGDLHSICASWTDILLKGVSLALIVLLILFTPVVRTIFIPYATEAKPEVNWVLPHRLLPFIKNRFTWVNWLILIIFAYILFF